MAITGVEILSEIKISCPVKVDRRLTAFDGIRVIGDPGRRYCLWRLVFDFIVDRQLLIAAGCRDRRP